ncbi:MAG TPA: transcription elongation factor 1 family protein [Candidatus Bathyarchaeia archaeon]|nr:transcription elongation factor 1 family protein [Candidatus Bathyarchaeia archaeon]
MGRRRRRVVRIVKKKLPTVFTCPRCGEEAVRVTIDKQTGHATVLCALCQLKDDFPAHPAAQTIDVYSYFTDRFYGVKDPRAIIPREREHVTAPTDEPEEPSLETSGNSTAIEVVPQTPLAELPTSTVPESSPTELEETGSSPVLSHEETGPEAIESSADENPEPAEAEEKTEAEEESEPFADILQENKDKKRYSPNPLPPQASEEA